MNAQTIEDSQELPLVTFNSLYSLLREEKKTKVLMKLPEKFYAGYQNFIEEKQEEAIKLTRNKENTKAMKEQKIILGSQNLINELLNLRLSKISSLAIKSTIFEDEEFSNKNILEDEKSFFEQTLKLSETAKKLI
jgi:DNA replication initiation complex subunit (GINS family)